jgi:hypothetical protein
MPGAGDSRMLLMALPIQRRCTELRAFAEQGPCRDLYDDPPHFSQDVVIDTG